MTKYSYQTIIKLSINCKQTFSINYIKYFGEFIFYVKEPLQYIIVEN